MSQKPFAAESTASALLRIGAVHVNTHRPFTLTSGAVSPVYIDCRKLISYPRPRALVINLALIAMYEGAGYKEFDMVAGGETAGIPFAAFYAQRWDMPMCYVRKQPKGFGRGTQIEGDLDKGSRVLLIEDLATDGGSKHVFIDALRAAGAICEHCFVIFYYDIFKQAESTLAKAGVKLHYLATWWDILAQMKKGGQFSPADLAITEDFLHDPQGWSDKHGGTR